MPSGRYDPSFGEWTQHAGESRYTHPRYGEVRKHAALLWYWWLTDGTRRGPYTTARGAMKAARLDMPR